MLRSEVNRPSIDFNELCLKDRLVYTCTTSSGLKWTVGTTSIGAYISSQGTTVVGATRTVASLPGVVANLTKMDDTLLTSTLTISSTETIVNELEIVCEGSSGIRKSLIFHQKCEIAWSCLTQLVGLSTGRFNLVACQSTLLSSCPTLSGSVDSITIVHGASDTKRITFANFTFIFKNLAPFWPPHLISHFNVVFPLTWLPRRVTTVQSCQGVTIVSLINAYIIYIQHGWFSISLSFPAVQKLIGLSGRNQTTANSINITITFNLSITNNVDIRGTATPVDDNSYSIVVTMLGPITKPELKVPFSALQAGTTYTFEIEAISRDNPTSCIGVGISGLLLQTDSADDLLRGMYDYNYVVSL